MDVETLFGYARDKVPGFARNVGGIQQPLFQPPSTPSFDIGELDTDGKKLIQLINPLPQLLQPRLSNKADGSDDLELENRLRKALRLGYVSSVQQRSLLGIHRLNHAVYVEADKMPGALKPEGQYERQGNSIIITIQLKRDGKLLATIQSSRPVNQLPVG